MAASEQTMITFSALSYSTIPQIGAFLANPPANSPAAEWRLVWGPVATVLTRGNLAYIAQTAGRCAVVVRGTYPHPDPAFFQDLFEDLTIGVQMDWPYSQTAGPKIAAGTMDGLKDVLSLKDPASGLSILDYLQQSPQAGLDIHVTGHSLGGCLSTVIASRLRYELGANANILPCTFAAPTAGNQAFADLFTSQFPNASRYFNTLDVIPKAWADLASVKALYPAPGPACPLVVAGVIDALSIPLKLLNYKQPNGGGIPLPGTPTATGDFVAEVLAQHDSANYLKLLGAPGLP